MEKRTTVRYTESRNIQRENYTERERETRGRYSGRLSDRDLERKRQRPKEKETET